MGVGPWPASLPLHRAPPSLIGIQEHAIGLFMEKLEPKSMGKAGAGAHSSYISVAAATTLQAACDGTILAHSMPFVLWGFSELNTIPLPRCSRRRRSCGTVERPESNLRVLS